MNAARHWLMLRTLAAAAIIATLVHLAESRDALSDLSRPLVTGILYFVGVDARDEGDTIRIGDMAVPWTRDCSGANLLMILLALGFWLNRAEWSAARFWLRMAALLPFALVANVARVLTLVGYRAAMYPAVENPQLHYFMGLVWLVPFIALLAPHDGRPRLHRTMEGLHAAAVVALLTPMSGAPHGGIGVIAAVVVLMNARVRVDRPRVRRALLVLWAIAGVATGLCGVESCWLPWLLVCPLLLDLAWLTQPAAWLVVATTNPMLSLLPGAEWLSTSALVLMGWKWWNAESKSQAVAPPSDDNMPLAASMSIACFALPFVASTLLAVGFEHATPPPNLIVTKLDGEGYELRLPGQPDSIGVLWYSPTSMDRHHTVKVCMKYRGAELDSVAESPDVFTDGEQWIRECFLQSCELQLSYAAYLRATFKPFAPPGAHVIFVTNCSNMTAAEFDSECLKLAGALTQICFAKAGNLIATQS